MRFPLTSLLAAAVLAAGSASAQPRVVPGEPALAAKAAPAPRLKLGAPREAARRVELVDAADAALREVRLANERDARGKPRAQLRRVVIGVVREAEGGRPAGPLRWTPVEGGLATRIALRSPGAEALRLALDLEGVPLAAELVFFGSADPGRLEGPVRVADIADRSLPWWTPLTEGDEQAVEVFVPAGTEAPRSLPVAHASHLVTGPSAGLAKRLQDIGASGSCNVDVACPGAYAGESFRQAAASVAQMVFTDGAYTALCTGTLLNDSDPSSQVPWFHSANHCFDNERPPYKTAAQMQAVASSLATIWGFEADACASARPLAGWRQLGGGAAFIHNDVASDALLLRLNAAAPAGAYYSGWDANPVLAGSAVVGIHHPQGDLKKVSEGSALRFTPAGPGGSYIEVAWSRGTTEGGSSGSGIWTAAGTQYLFRGGLWGGTALCSNPSGTDFYSRFDRVYPAISAYLGASGGGIDYTDLWWSPSESGWGLNLIQHPSRIVFGVWYTYAADGKRTWYVMPSGSWIEPNTYTGALYEAAGPHLAQAFDASKVHVSPVGSATLAFSDASHGTFTYTVHGTSGTKAITRQPF